MEATQKKITTQESFNYMGSYPVFENSKYETRLYDYLFKYYPEIKNNAQFIKEKAATVVQNMRKREAREDVSNFTLDLEATETLYAGFGFSRFEIIDSILMDLYDDFFSEDKTIHTFYEMYNAIVRETLTAGEQRGIVAYTLQTNLEHVFTKYDINNPEFEATSQYDKLRAELTTEIKKMVTENDLLNDFLTNL